jgi:hypothetical protein
MDSLWYICFIQPWWISSTISCKIPQSKVPQRWKRFCPSLDTLLRIAWDAKKHKSLKHIDIGTKAKLLLSEKLFLDEISNVFWKECLSYYKVVA